MTAKAADCLLRDADGALAEGDWARALTGYRRALDIAETPQALEGMSWAALGLNDGETVIWARQAAYRLFRRGGENVSAARMAMWLGKDYADFLGELAVARGWRQRAHRLLEGQPLSPEHGWLAILECWAPLACGEDPVAVQARARNALAVAQQLRDPDIEILALAIEGLACVDEGRIEEGMARLDEAAAAVLGGELEHEIWALAVFCFLIYACKRVRDVNRAAQWCELMRQLADRLRHTGTQATCRAHYAAVMISRGDWQAAEATLADAVAYYEASWPPQSAEAIVSLADLRRRQGRLDEARDLLNRAAWHPRAALGLAQIAFDAGQLRESGEELDRFLRHIPEDNRLERIPALELRVEIVSLSGAREQAAAVLADLEDAAGRIATPLLRGSICVAKAALARAFGDLERAQACCEDAADMFEQSWAPYETARARLDLADVLAALGETARAREQAAMARRESNRLGAALLSERAEAFLAEIDRQMAERENAPGSAPLTRRQIEILDLVSRGFSDREISETLGISEHTVHRHMANILLRMDVPTRAAAVARAASCGLL